MARPADIAPLAVPSEDGRSDEISIVVPVLNEATRLPTLLACLRNVDVSVAEILVVDGGSSDGTQALVLREAETNRRLRLLDAPSSPSDWNGKAWNLHCGTQAAGGRYLLFLDADVTIEPRLPQTLRRALETESVAALMAATRQHCEGALHTALHAALLTTLIYRTGRPGRRLRTVGDIVANGQVCFVDAEALRTSDACRASRAAKADDFAFTEALIAHGYVAAFVEMQTPPEVRMYASSAELLANWPRSLALVDSRRPLRGMLRLLDLLGIAVVPQLLAFARTKSPGLRILTAIAFMLRIGTLVGTAHAYRRTGLGYWLSPIADIPAASSLIAQLCNPQATWRGRRMVSQ